MIVIQEWTEPPQMNTSAPQPEIYYGRSVHCAYLTRDNKVALVRFDNVLLCKVGYPNDEALGAHPLYKSGLSHYAFYLIENSALIDELDKVNESHPCHITGSTAERFKHWVVTFHDETLEVVAGSATVVHSEAVSKQEAIVGALAMQRS